MGRVSSGGVASCVPWHDDPRSLAILEAAGEMQA